MSNNIIIATFDGGNLVYVCPRYQYDYGQILKFTDLDLPFAYECHFSNTDQTGNSVTQIGDENGVIVPDAMFLSGDTIYAWVYLHSTEDDGETVYKVVIPVQKRAKPTNATPTPVQQDAITQAIAALDAGVEAAEAAKQAIEDMGVSSTTLAPGSSATVEKEVDPDTGAITLEFGIPEGQQGQQGNPGRDGYSPTVTVEDITGGHRVTITDKNGSHVVDVMNGEQGEQGDPGQDGFSPVVVVTDITGGHQVAITDAQGTQTFDVLDGEVTEDALEERLIDKADVITSSASGEIVTIQDGGNDLPVVDLKVSLLPVQSGSGDPSPSNIRPISGWTGVDIQQTGGNLINWDEVITVPTKTYRGITFTYSDGIVSVTGTTTDVCAIALDNGSTASYSSSFAVRNNGTLLPPGVYRCNFPCIYGSNVGGDYDDEGNGRALAGDDINLPNGGYVRPYVGYSANYTVNISQAITVYRVKTYPITWQSVGTVYGCSLDVTNGVLTVYDVGITATNENTFRSSASQKNTYGTLFDITVDLEPNHSTTLLEMSNIFAPGVHSYQNVQNGQFYAVYASSSNPNCMRVCWGQPRGASTLDEFKAFLQENPAQFVYELATPLNYQLTGTQINTFIGQNDFSSNGNGTIDLEYRADTKLYIEQLTKPTEDDMVANANITSGSFFMVGNRLFLSTTAIAQGEQIVVGTNCSEVSLADALNQINA